MLTFFTAGIPTITGTKMIIPRFTAFLQRRREKLYTYMLPNNRESHTHTHTRIDVTFPTGALVST